MTKDLYQEEFIRADFRILFELRLGFSSNMDKLARKECKTAKGLAWNGGKVWNREDRYCIS